MPKSPEPTTINSIQYDVQLAANIVRARMERGMTQKQLAKRVGVVQPAIARAENGRVPPTHSLLKKIAKALKMRLIPSDFV